MFKKMVVAPDQMPGMFEKLGKAMAEIWKQALRGLWEPGKGLSLDQLQLFIEHRNPFAKVTTRIADVYKNSGSRDPGGSVPFVHWRDSLGDWLEGRGQRRPCQ